MCLRAARAQVVQPDGGTGVCDAGRRPDDPEAGEPRRLEVGHATAPREAACTRDTGPVDPRASPGKRARRHQRRGPAGAGARCARSLARSVVQLSRTQAERRTSPCRARIFGLPRSNVKPDLLPVGRLPRTRRAPLRRTCSGPPCSRSRPPRTRCLRGRASPWSPAGMRGSLGAVCSGRRARPWLRSRTPSPAPPGRLFQRTRRTTTRTTTTTPTT